MDPELKGVLKGLSLTFRYLLEGFHEGEHWHPGDLERRLNELGVWRDRDSKSLGELPQLTEADIKARKIVDAYIKYREGSGVKRTDAFEEFVRESAYTWFNRLFALRCMEARGIIDEVILQKDVYGWRSLQHNRLTQRHPDLCTGEDDGLYALLFQEFERRAEELPILFNPEAPAVELRPSVAAIKKCIALLSGRELVNGRYASNDVFIAPDAFGWAYQYWNSEEKNRIFEKVRTNKAKIEGADIIPVTCIYTEPYMVKFLVQNSLGAIWMGMHPSSRLAKEWEYYVEDADRVPVDKKLINEVTFLDPACGSGHFLLEAFDFFYEMYQEEGIISDPEEICASILNNNLFGIDIDERAVQISIAVLWMKAKGKASGLEAKDLSDFHDHLVATNIQLSKDIDHLESFLKKHPEDHPLRSALETVFKALANAHELGSLLQIEEPVEKELQYIRNKLGAQKTLFGPKNDEEWETWRRTVVNRLREHFAAEAVSPVLGQFFFSQSAGKGLKIFEMFSRRYDIVATNPPYMGSKNMGLSLKKYIEYYYSPGKRDLFAAFILRCFELAKERGKVAMVTQQSWMFLRSYIELRALQKEEILSSKEAFNGLLREVSFETLAHLGVRSFSETSGEVVNVILFTFSKVIPQNDHRVYSIRLTGLRDLEEKKEFLKHSNHKSSSSVYIPKQKDFIRIPNASIIYWLSNRFLELFQGPLVEKYVDVVQGLITADNDRFVRFYWEIADEDRWKILEKGGGYGKWYGHHHWVVDWQHGGARIANSRNPRVQNVDFYFRSGWTYSYMACGSLGLRAMEDSIFAGGASTGVFPHNNFPVAALIGNRLGSFFIRSLSSKIQLSESYVQRIPVPRTYASWLLDVEKIQVSYAEYLSSLQIREHNYLPRTFKVKDLSNIIQNFLTRYLAVDAIIRSIDGLVLRQVFIDYQLDHDDVKKVTRETGTPAGWFPLIPGYNELPMFPCGLPRPPHEVLHLLEHHRLKTITSNKLISLKSVLRSLYETGPGAKEIDRETEIAEDESEVHTGTRVPVPAETFLEELSRKIEINPITVYWLLKEGIEQNGWRCLPEEQRIAMDWFTVTILQLLGHRWPKQVEAQESIPNWADRDGIIPLTSNMNEPTLLDRIRERLNQDFEDNASSVERDFEGIMGIPLEEWLLSYFFKHHTSQFMRRPIAWQIQSNYSVTSDRGRPRTEPAFSCLVYYQKMDEDTLPKLRSQYLGPLRSRYEMELKTLEAIGELDANQTERRIRLEEIIEELEKFDKALEKTIEEGFDSEILRDIVKNEPLDDWTSIDGVSPYPSSTDEFYVQERAYFPDINDGVRVNIAPLQKAGLLATDVLSKNDIDKAIINRAEWRADERRWCREGKIPKPGWWK